MILARLAIFKNDTQVTTNERKKSIIQHFFCLLIRYKFIYNYFKINYIF